MSGSGSSRRPPASRGERTDAIPLYARARLHEGRVRGYGRLMAPRARALGLFFKRCRETVGETLRDVEAAAKASGLPAASRGVFAHIESFATLRATDHLPVKVNWWVVDWWADRYGFTMGEVQEVTRAGEHSTLLLARHVRRPLSPYRQQQLDLFEAFLYSLDDAEARERAGLPQERGVEEELGASRASDDLDLAAAAARFNLPIQQAQEEIARAAERHPRQREQRASTGTDLAT